MKTQSTGLFTGWTIVTAAIILLAAMIPCLPPCTPTEPVEIPEFILGTSQGGVNEMPYVAELGARWMRGKVAWGQVEPEIFERQYSVDDIDANPELIAEYIENGNWAASDNFLAQLQAHGLEPLMILGHGFTNTLPYYEGSRATPDVLDQSYYLGHIYLYARATVERYDGDGTLDSPDGLVVKFWQLENELNQAFFTAMWGWRSPSFADAVGSAWQDWDFLTKLVHVLHRAVKMEDPHALTTVNFHTDVPDTLNYRMRHPSWSEAIRLWVDYVDVVGIDAYPNYYKPEPVLGEVLRDRVCKAKEMGCDKPVMVIETGYPTGPAERGYTEAGQAQYIQEAYDASVEAGAQGFFLFGVRTGESHSVNITRKDLENLAFLVYHFERDRYFRLIVWVVRNADYIENHFVDVLQSVEPYWGLVRADGSHKPGWDVYQTIAATH